MGVCGSSPQAFGSCSAFPLIYDNIFSICFSFIYWVCLVARGARFARSSRRLCNEGDRKSTRLNSSHSQISYAVFCLKKKKKHYTLEASIEHLALFYYISHLHL